MHFGDIHATYLHKTAMNVTISFLLGELLFVSLLVLTFLVIARWRKRKRLIAELAGLLERVNRSELDRQTRLQERLVESFGLEEDDAESLSLEIIRAERKLFKTFTEIQFGVDIRKVNTFDKSVYALLDNYWELLAREKPEPMKTTLREPESDYGEDFTVDVDDESLGGQSESISGEVPGDAETTGREEDFEDLDAMDSFSEPTWDDAFAEEDHSQEPAELADETIKY